MKHFFLLIFFIGSLLYVKCQQSTDNSFRVEITVPKYLKGEGPTIYIDNSHNNLHTLEGGLKPFGELMKADGYSVESWNGSFLPSEESILVIANALNKENLGNWERPIYSAFTSEFINNLKDWVFSGGKLLLIADHMPFAGAAKDLGRAFGIEYIDGFAQLSEQTNGNDVFSKENGRLAYYLQVNEVTTFTGSAFRVYGDFDPILSFKQGDLCLIPEVAWQFEENTELKSLANHYQGAFVRYGRGRICVFGEAAMFTAQKVSNDDGTFKVGFNSPTAPKNISFIREVVYKLSNGIPQNTSDFGKEEILNINRKMEDLFKDKKYREIAAFYTEDAIMTGPNVAVVGRSNLKDYWSIFSKSNTISWDIINIDIKPLGETYALQRGLSKMKYQNSGKIMESTSMFSLIWKKTFDGWRMYLDHFSPPPSDLKSNYN